MEVSYKGFTGKLMKLYVQDWGYTISIYDAENKCTHNFEGVNLKDVKFLGGAVTFDE